MKKIENKKALIFDVDGTLWDSVHVITIAWGDAIKDHTDLPVNFDDEVLTRLFGNTMKDIFDTLYPEVPAEEFAKVEPYLYEYQYRYLIDYKNPLYEGMKETLKTLGEKYDLYVVTNANVGYVESVIKANGLQGYFKDWMCYGDTKQVKSFTIRALMDRCGIDPERAVYIGDTHMDEEASSAAGIDFIYCNYGMGKAKSPMAEISKPTELLELFF